MPPKQFIEALAKIANEARHHPEPALVVAELAQLLHTLALELMPIAEKFAFVLGAAGFPPEQVVAELDKAIASLTGLNDTEIQEEPEAGQAAAAGQTVTKNQA